MSACTRILGLEGTPDGVEDSGSVTRVAAFPIGIDPDRFTQALETDVVKTHIAELKARFAGRKVGAGYVGCWMVEVLVRVDDLISSLKPVGRRLKEALCDAGEMRDGVRNLLQDLEKALSRSVDSLGGSN